MLSGHAIGETPLSSQLDALQDNDMHLRRQIREAVAGAVTGLATTGARVYQSRVYPLQEAELPALVVFTKNETSQPATIHVARTIERELELHVLAVAKANADLDDTLDQICEEVEVALAMPLAALNGKATSIYLAATDFDLQGTAERPTGTALLSYRVAYFNQENAPDVAL